MDEKENQDKKQEIKISPRNISMDGRLKLKATPTGDFACEVKRWGYHFFATENTDVKNQSGIKENPVLYILIGEMQENNKTVTILYAGQTAGIEERNSKRKDKAKYSRSLCFSAPEEVLSTNDMVFLERGAVAMITGIAEKSKGKIQVANIANPTASSHYHAAPTMLNPLQMLTIVGIMYSLLASQLPAIQNLIDENKNQEWNGSIVLKAIMVNPDKKAEGRKGQIENADRLYDSLRYTFSRRRIKWLRHQNTHKQMKDISTQSVLWLRILTIVELIIIIFLLATLYFLVLKIQMGF